MKFLVSLLAGALALAWPGLAAAVPVSSDPLPSVTFNGAVRTAVYAGFVIYIGGDFTHATFDGSRIRRTRLAAVDARDGSLLDWTPTADATVTGIAADSTGIYIAGGFEHVNGVPRDSLAKLDLVTGHLHPGFRHIIYGQPRSIAVSHGRVYLGGNLSSVNGEPRHNAAAFDTATGQLDGQWQPKIAGTVHAITAGPDRIYLGGRFRDINGAAHTKKLAAVDLDTGQVDAGFRARVHNLVIALHADGDRIYAGIDGTGGKAVAMDLSGEHQWTRRADGGVQAVTVLNDTVYLGGHFDNICDTVAAGVNGACLDGSQPRGKLAALTTDGELLPWNPQANGVHGVYTLIANGWLGQLAAGGTFTVVNDQLQRRFALLNLPQAQ